MFRSQTTSSPKNFSASAWSSPLLAVAVACALLTLAACAPESPEERVAGLRAGYEVEVNAGGFTAQPNLPEPEIMLDEEGNLIEADAEPADDAIDGMDAGMMDEGAMAPAMEPESYDVVIDMMVKNGNRETLSQLTVDIVQLDGDLQEKSRTLAVLDTSGVLPGAASQMSHMLDDFNYAPGDVFTVEVLTPVPAEKRGDYIEFSS